MNRFLYPAVVTLALWTVVPPGAADAQDMARAPESSRAARPLQLTVPESVRLSNRVQDATNTRSERGVGRKILGAIVGAAGGFFAGGYLGAAIEGDRCHCDDPGLKGALIGAPVGAAAGGVLGWRYLF